jgi:hypothetical protein
MACDASPNKATAFSVAHRGPPSASVLKNPWPDTHSGIEWRDTEPLHNVQCPGICAVDPRENRPACRQPINFNDAGHQRRSRPKLERLPGDPGTGHSECGRRLLYAQAQGGRSRPPRCHLKGRSDVRHKRVRTFGHLHIPSVDQCRLARRESVHRGRREFFIGVNQFTAKLPPAAGLWCEDPESR